ncbi:MFS general substrate transporter [Hyaloscypha variabilis F]|uniref:MFS general substrate transporter n=1 Tax=Hyaloscypha variabilis (strain UAMH 11265 / GT02V1 / F) TaxID=1149755 RepID=A0A2J6S4H1_HYAVF|nr:MFS general substrate transporter [Hyaloscypha variabilis F]
MHWEEEAYSRTDKDGNPVSFVEYEKQALGKKLGGFMTGGDLMLYSITGVGFFLDSYDLFIINLMSPIWAYEYWNGHYPPLLRGAVNAASNIGNIIGQLSFGFLGDAFGRKFVYGKELIICIIGTILVISLPNSIPTPTLKMIWIFCFRLLMGIGIGGDYPMSASIVSERSHLHTRGRLLAWIFSNQGWGTLTGSVATIIILSCFRKSIKEEGHYNELDAVWRIQMGIALVPAFATLIPRLRMPEGRKYVESRALNTPASPVSNVHHERASTDPETNAIQNIPGLASTSDSTIPKPQKLTDLPAIPLNITDLEKLDPLTSRKAKLNAFFVYFSEWRHLKTLIGTASCWFLLDVAFYGTNLNQSVLLADIGYSTGKTHFDVLMRNAIGNLIIAVSGYVPGYFFTIFLVEKMGRKWIQIQGFLVCALMFAILAGGYTKLSTGGKFACFAIAQFFFNFGPNATTFIIPAEVYPSRVRGFAHGFSAAVGKLGAILSALLFNYLSGSTVIGLANVLWIFFACNMLGALSTWFLIPETKGRDADVVDFREWQEAAGEKVSKK